MLVHPILFEVRHHISKSSLSRRLSSLLLYFVHLLEILLGHWIELGSETVLSLQGSRLRFGHLVDLEAAAHGRVHHYLAWSLYLLQTVKGYVVEVARAV